MSDKKTKQIQNENSLIDRGNLYNYDAWRYNFEFASRITLYTIPRR